MARFLKFKMLFAINKTENGGQFYRKISNYGYV